MPIPDDLRDRPLLLPANRVWRTYPGGKTLDQIDGNPNPADSHMSEDWIGSVTQARNVGRESITEGVSTVRTGDDNASGTDHPDLAQLIADDPDYFLGAAHVARYGADPKLLVKYLDSATRLHFQVHPTSAFAQKHLGQPSGKTEAYYILAVRDDLTEPAYIYVGFQRPPAPEALKQMIEAQDIAGLEACFDKIPVKPGDAFMIPGGTPHALGPGVLMVEIQEPSDLVIRFEFERGGYVLPESARFMDKGIDFGLTIFDLTALTPDDLASRVRCHPTRLAEHDDGSYVDQLIGPQNTDCFRVTTTHLAGPVTRAPGAFSIAIVTKGRVQAKVGQHTITLNPYERALLPAGLGPVQWHPLTDTADVLECHPPSA